MPRKIGISAFGLVARLGLAAAWLGWYPLSATGAEAQATLPDYRRVDGITGTLSSVGSDSLANLMTLWGQAFKHIYPNFTLQIQAAGSSTAPPALIEGVSSLGPMSRSMTFSEASAFEARYGYKPTAIRVAVDLMAVFVNRDNPVAGITIPQLDAVFSATRNCGYPQAVTAWGQLGLTGAWRQRRIQLYGRNALSGSYAYFKEKALCKGEYRATVTKQPGSAAVVQAVAAAPDGIGYASIGYRTAGVRAIPLAATSGEQFVEPTPDNAVAGRYPLARFLYVYCNKPPDRSLPPLEKEFLTLVLSRAGQRVVIKDGYVPLSADLVEEERAKLE